MTPLPEVQLQMEPLSTHHLACLHHRLSILSYSCPSTYQCNRVFSLTGFSSHYRPEFLFSLNQQCLVHNFVVQGEILKPQGRIVHLGQSVQYHCLRSRSQFGVSFSRYTNITIWKTHRYLKSTMSTISSAELLIKSKIGKLTCKFLLTSLQKTWTKTGNKYKQFQDLT